MKINRAKIKSGAFIVPLFLYLMSKNVDKKLGVFCIIFG